MRPPEGNGFCLEDPTDTAGRQVWNVTFACAEPRELGRFWAFALGWPDEEIDPSLIETIHLDFGTNDREAEIERLRKPARRWSRRSKGRTSPSRSCGIPRGTRSASASPRACSAPRSRAPRRAHSPCDADRRSSSCGSRPSQRLSSRLNLVGHSFDRSRARRTHKATFKNRTVSDAAASGGNQSGMSRRA